MKKIRILVCCFLVFTTLQAQKSLSQDFDYSISEPYQVYDAAKKFYFSQENEILTVKPWRKYIVIQKFNVDDLSLISSKEYLDFPDNYVVEGMEEVGGRYYFFYSSWTGRKTQHEQLFFWEIDFEKGEFIGEPKKLIDFSGHLAGGPGVALLNIPGWQGITGMFGVVDKFDFLKSKDGSKLLAHYRKKPEVKRDTKSYDVIGINVYDSNLNKLWAKEYKMPYTERRMDALDFAVDSNGDGYMLVKVFHDDSNDDKKRKKDEEANYHIELFRLLQGDNEIEITKIEVEDKYINGISLFESPEGFIICAGFYNSGLKNGFFSNATSKFQLSNSDGLFTFKVTRDGELIDKHYYEIPLEILNQYVSDRTKRKNEKKEKDDEVEFKYLRLNDLIVKADGSLVLVGEQKYVIRHTTSKGVVYYTYHYNDMLIAKIGSSGELAWMKKLPKIQYGKPKIGQVFDYSKIYKGGMSYSYLFADNAHYLLFLDNVKNIDLELNQRPALHSDGHGGYLTAYKIDDLTGDVAKDNIFDTRNVTDDLEVHQFSVDRVIKTKENEFVLEFYKKKKEDILIKVKVKTGQDSK
ncbi:hypothetical protein [Mangrovimonas sp. YM274]|uniref:hypothetical protein n=1 Tax=Mangrovimonas sp. YM274 TaxID=3070660 RepID=UPI0027DD0AFE|nr:hypothetical protein [Mangrovimonas sp. YM274]WMI69456.1 hypothetical protein RBH95_03600 [Mangrovimonas sp. YM274]